MSRSTNASKGTPDDDEGRLGDDRDDLPDEASEQPESHDSVEPTDADAIDDEVSDAVDEADSDEDDSHEADSDEADSDEADSDQQVAAASTPSRSATTGRSTAARATGAARGSKPAAKRPATGPITKNDERRGPIAAIVLFVRQVIAELRKVVTPTTKELWTYSAVVIVFVLIIMAYVGVLDLAVGRLVLWAFGG